MTLPDDARSGGVCSPWAELGDMTCQSYEADDTKLEQALLMSSGILYQLTGRRWPGLCVTTVRPMGAEPAPGPARWPAGGPGASAGRPWLADPTVRGVWLGCTCNRSVRTGCDGVPELRLADRVVSIEEVKIDGVVVPADEYRLDDHRYLVGLTRPDGTERTWPCCQNAGLADTQPGTFSVRFTRGGLPDVGGTAAAASLGCELAKGMGWLTVGDKCRLPKRVTSIVRQNVTVAVLDPLTLFQEGRTGLPDVDMWVAAVNKGPAMRRGTLIPMGRRRGSRRAGS